MTAKPRAPRLVIIDGHSIIHRSYHAMKQLAEPLRIRATGELVGAPFGFANTFLSMFAELKPTHVIVALDKGAVTFRNEIAESYKATRVPMPDDEREEFNRQFERCRQVIDTFGIPMIEKDNYEADDLMGTLAAQAAEQGIEAYLVSMDSDIAQLVQEGVHLWMYRPYQRDSVIFKTADDVKDRYLVFPNQMTDLKALKGDTSDNIAGIPGVGDKTAAKLIEQFGSIEEMLDRTDEIKSERQRGLITDHVDQLRQSKLLATIVCDVPDITLDIDTSDFYAHYDPTRVGDLFRELEFRTLVTRLPEKEGAAAPTPAAELAAEQNFSVVRDEKAPLAVLILAGVLTPVLFGLVPIAIAAVGGATLMVLLRCMTMEEAYRSVEWRSIFLIAGMLPLGLAMQQTGAANLIAEGVLQIAGSLGPWGIIVGLYLVTAAATMVIPTAALVVLMAPIVLKASADMGVSPQTSMMAIAIAASASFTSPISHPANLLVMGPGGYRFKDYVKIGVPLTIVVLIVTMLLLPWVWPLTGE